MKSMLCVVVCVLICPVETGLSVSLNGHLHADLKDNYAVLKKLEADLENSLFDVGYTNDVDNDECQENNNNTEPGFPYPLHASCRVEW